MSFRSDFTRALQLAMLLSAALIPSAAYAQSTAPATPVETPPPPAAPRPATVPKPVEHTLPNGLRVIVIEDNDMPLISAQLLVKNGGEVDPTALSGLADVTASLLTKGTKTRTAPQIAQEIEALGGTIGSGAGWDASRALVSVLSSKIDPALTILADVVRNPAFSDEEIERLRQQYLDSLSVEMNDPGSVAGFVAARVVFGDAAYGHPLSGTTASITQIKRQDITALHAKYYRPDNAVLVLGGDIKAAAAFKLAEKTFGTWAKPAGALPERGSGAKAGGDAKARVVVVDMPDAGQAAVVLARTGISRTDPDYFRGIVTNAVLTGYSGRLNQEIRIKRGLSYGARSNLETRRDTGPFVASAQTKNPSGAEVASLLVGELGRLSNEPVKESELVPRKAVLIGGFGRALETTEGLVAQVAALALYGLKLDEINSYINRVQSITPEDVQRFASSRLDSRRANIIIVGNAKEFLPELRKRYTEVEVIALTDLDLNTPTLKKATVGVAK
jgi:zinc protease